MLLQFFAFLEWFLSLAEREREKEGAFSCFARRSVQELLRRLDLEILRKNRSDGLYEAGIQN